MVRYSLDEGVAHSRRYEVVPCVYQVAVVCVIDVAEVQCCVGSSEIVCIIADVGVGELTDVHTVDVRIRGCARCSAVNDVYFFIDDVAYSAVSAVDPVGFCYVKADGVCGVKRVSAVVAVVDPECLQGARVRRECQRRDCRCRLCRHRSRARLCRPATHPSRFDTALSVLPDRMVLRLSGLSYNSLPRHW